MSVTHSGTLYCRKANIRGTIIADSGIIGDWKITNSRLENNDGSVYLSATSGLKLGDNFKVNTVGKLEATGVSIDGRIVASTGRIGNW